MARKKGGGDEGGGQEWMNTYSDLVTLLMTFFVLLFSMSSVDAEKWEAFVKAFNKAGDQTAQIVINADNADGDAPVTNGGDAYQIQDNEGDELATLPTDFDELFAYLKDFVEQSGLDSSVEVMTDGQNAVYIRFQNNIFFAPDKSDLLPDGLYILDFLGDCLAAVQDQIYVISINGHTADVGFDDYAVSEWMLSSERAGRVADYLDADKHVDPTKLRPMGYGKSFPVADNSTEEGKQENRRVDMTIVRDSSANTGLEQQLASLFDPSQFPKPGSLQDIWEADTTPGTHDLPTGAEDILEQLIRDAAAEQAATAPDANAAPAPDANVTPAPNDGGGTVIPPPDAAGGQTAPIAGTQE